jgi:uncharacterized protein
MLDFKRNFADMGVLEKMIVASAALLALFLLVLAVYFGKLLFLGRSIDNMPSNISVSATGEANAVPNIATFTFAVVETGKDVNEAQGKMITKANQAIDFVKSKGIEEKDIQTTTYSANPRYEYGPYTIGRPQNPTLVGYEVRQNIKVKVRDMAKTGELLSGVGQLNVSELSGLNFETDDPEALKFQATEQAIQKAKEKAEKLAEQMGVRLVKVVGFYEEMQPPYPMPYAGDSSIMERQSASPAVPAPILPGENTVKSTVSITYEIR